MLWDTSQSLTPLQVPVPLLHHATTRILTCLLAKLTLWTLGIVWPNVEIVTKKRTYVISIKAPLHLILIWFYWSSRSAQRNEPWSPGAGDIIISNWASWIEILWLAARWVPSQWLVLRFSVNVALSKLQPGVCTPSARVSSRIWKEYQPFSTHHK